MLHKTRSRISRRVLAPTGRRHGRAGRIPRSRFTGILTQVFQATAHQGTFRGLRLTYQTRQRPPRDLREVYRTTLLRVAPSPGLPDKTCHIPHSQPFSSPEARVPLRMRRTVTLRSRLLFIRPTSAIPLRRPWSRIGKPIRIRSGTALDLRILWTATVRFTAHRRI